MCQSYAGFFIMRYKHKKIFHVPWSKGLTRDDKIHKDMDFFVGKNIVVTEKMDGENTSIYNDYTHARSVDSKYHPSRAWVRNFYSKIRHNIPDGWRVCGENLYAIHSIYYKNLKDYFLAFSVWDKNNFCLSWEDTEKFAESAGIKTVDVLYKGVYREDILKTLYSTHSLNGDECEGYVIRLADSFSYHEFEKCVAKFVRENHVSTDSHWMFRQFKINELKND